MNRYGLFRYGSLDYAVPLLKMQRIVHQFCGYRLPRLPTAVAEVLVVGGQLVPLLKLPTTAIEGLSARTVEYKVLMESEAGVVAFPAEVSCGIVAEQKGDLAPADDKQFSGVTGIFKYQTKEYKILDIDFLAMEMTQKV